MKLIIRGTLLLILVAATACSSSEGQFAAMNNATFKDNCGQCHNHRNPEDYSAPRWEKIAGIMGGKANLNEAQISEITSLHPEIQ